MDARTVFIDTVTSHEEQAWNSAQLGSPVTVPVIDAVLVQVTTTVPTSLP